MSNALFEKKKKRVIHLWEENIYFYTPGKYPYYDDIRAYFLDESLPFPEKKEFQESEHYSDIIENMMRVHPKRMIAFILDRAIFEFSGYHTLLPLLGHSLYLAKNISLEAIKILFSKSGSFIQAIFIEQLIIHNSDKFSGLLREYAQGYLDNINLDENILKEHALLDITKFYYDTLKQTMVEKEFKAFAPSMIQIFLSKTPRTEYNPFSEHIPDGIYFLTQLADFMDEEGYFEKVQDYFKNHTSFNNCVAFIKDKLPDKEECLLRILLTRESDVVMEPHSNVFTALHKYDFQDCYDDAWIYLYNGRYSYDADIKVACEVLNKYPEMFFKKVSDNFIKDPLKMLSYLTKVDSDESFRMLIEVYEEKCDKDTQESFSRDLNEYLENDAGLKGTEHNVRLLRNSGKLECWTFEFNEYDLPPIYLTSGKMASIVEIRYLFTHYRNIYDLNPSSLYKCIDREKNNALFDFLLENYNERSFSACLSIAALCLNESNFFVFKALFIKLCEEDSFNYPVLAGLMIYATDESLSLVNTQFPDKNRPFEELAKAKGVDVKELYARCASLYSFDGVSKVFLSKNQEYTAFISNNFELQFYDSKNNLIDEQPLADDKQVEQEFKSIKNSLCSTKEKTENAFLKNMTNASSWHFGSFSNVYLSSPISLRCATAVVFALLHEGKVKTLFSINGNSDCVDEKENVLAIDADALICVVHPCQLSKYEIKYFKQKLVNEGIENLIFQLDRPFFTIKEQEQLMHGVNRYNEVEAVNDTQDARMILKKHDYEIYSDPIGGYLEFNFSPQDNIEVTLGIEGMTSAHYSDNEEIEFVDTIFKDTSGFPDVALKLQDVPPAIFSEAMAVLEELAYTEYDGEYDEDDEDDEY